MTLDDQIKAVDGWSRDNLRAYLIDHGQVEWRGGELNRWSRGELVSAVCEIVREEYRQASELAEERWREHKGWSADD